MKTTSKSLTTLIGFNKGSASLNFPLNVITKIGLVRTHSIHYSIHKNGKIIGINRVAKKQ